MPASVLQTVKPLMTGLGAIGLASAILLLSDAPSRRRPVAGNEPQKVQSTRPLAKTWRVHVLEYVNLPDVDDAERGVRDAIREAGLHDGTDYTYRVSNAQGDMATLNGLVDADLTDQADMIVTL